MNFITSNKFSNLEFQKIIQVSIIKVLKGKLNELLIYIESSLKNNLTFHYIKKENLHKKIKKKENEII